MDNNPTFSRKGTTMKKPNDYGKDRMDWLKNIMSFQRHFHAWLVVSVVGICGGVFTFTLGFHNFDLGHNLAHINEMFGAELVDMGTSAGAIVLRTPPEITALGGQQMIHGFWMALLFAIAFGLLYGYIYRDHNGGMHERQDQP